MPGILSRRRAVGRLATVLFTVMVGGPVGCVGGGDPSPPGAGGQGEALLVFAAASLADVIRELADAFTVAEGVAVELNLAGSNALARQVLAAEGPDVFLSADRSWMDHVEEEGRLLPGTRSDVFSNRLVLVARLDSAVAIGAVEDLATARFRHLSVADPEAVPAGRYASAYLSAISDPTSEGNDLWSRLLPKLVPALDTRAALALVASDPEIVGIVYRTDALASERVRILAEVPALAGIPIVYAGAALRGARNEAGARRFLAFLDSDEGSAISRRHGFLPFELPMAVAAP